MIVEPTSTGPGVQPNYPSPSNGLQMHGAVKIMFVLDQFVN